MRRILVILLCALLVGPAPPPAPAGVISISGGARMFVAPPAATDPYPLYTSFDRNDIPWHASSGVLGAQEAFPAPTAPTTTSTSSCSTRTACISAAAVNGRQVTVTGWDSGDLSITGDDVTVIVNQGVTIPDTVIISGDRVRIRGETLGVHSGGLIGQIRSFNWPEGNTDIHIDGVDINAASASMGGGAESNTCVRAGFMVRLAFTNVRMLCPGYGYLDAATYVFFGNVSLYGGAWERGVSPLTYVEGVGIRTTGGPWVIVDSRIVTTRYATIRWQPVNGSRTIERAYMKNSVIGNTAEGRATWFNNLAQCDPDCVDAGFVYENVDMYGYTTSPCVFGAEVNTASANYSAWNGGTFYNGGTTNYTQGYLNGQLDSATGLSFGTWSDYSEFPWGPMGDPSAEIPLPPGFSGPVIRGDSSCPGVPEA